MSHGDRNANVDAARAARLLLAIVNDDTDAYQRVMAEVGTCYECLASLIWITTTAVARLMERLGDAEEVSAEIEPELARLLDELAQEDQ
ncbi:hypothetical protein [Mycobacterium sp. OTB74]|jgi:hypothetical protein|uniref:hypothetical protein n=1 Tax=Mycobacterium sp. OTB74 TaxID=1853452 RepID=UPI0024752753|nr:hypothetical protein [Mycobacterium sp. OTB74]MDH6245171.1 hypothetical protein [Mycobacterium sp. OTB74]